MRFGIALAVVITVAVIGLVGLLLLHRTDPLESVYGPDNEAGI